MPSSFAGLVLQLTHHILRMASLTALSELCALCSTPSHSNSLTCWLAFTSSQDWTLFLTKWLYLFAYCLYPLGTVSSVSLKTTSALFLPIYLTSNAGPGIWQTFSMNAWQKNSSISGHFSGILLTRMAMGQKYKLSRAYPDMRLVEFIPGFTFIKNLTFRFLTLSLN